MSKETMKLVDLLKRRRVFVSLIVTMTRLEFSWWNGEKVVTGDKDSVKLWLRGQDENDRRELVRISRRMGLVS